MDAVSVAARAYLGDRAVAVGVNWLFLVECLVAIVVVVFFLFYLNRLVAIVVGLILRGLLWRSHNAYIEFESIQISPLGGRILFKEARYYSKNISMRVLKGHITWRYWFWRAREEQSEEREGKASRLPCRTVIWLEGAEMLLYNRTPSFDAILRRMGYDPEKLASPRSEHGAPSEKGESGKYDEAVSSNVKSPNRDEISETDGDRTKADGADEPAPRGGIDWFREALPIEIQVARGAFVLGNDSTPSILIADFESAQGRYSAVKARSQYDPYKQVYHFVFKKPKIIWRTNPDFEGPMTNHGQAVLHSLGKKPTNLGAPDPLAMLALFHRLRSVSQKLSFRTESQRRRSTAFTSRSQSVPAASAARPWRGLSRYLTEEEAAGGNAPNSEEYAKVSTMLDCPEMELTYYADVAGKVPKDPKPLSGMAGLETIDVGNGDLSPEWGIDMEFKGGTVNYGPWADRQRAFIQKIFFPPAYLDSEQTRPLKPGDNRVHTSLKIFIEFSAATTLRLPTREASKNWRFEGVDRPVDKGKPSRPYGWLDVKVGPNSTINHTMSMVSDASGFSQFLEVHLDEVSLTSSVNYAEFWSAEYCRVHCDLSSPLKWRDLRTWEFTINFFRPKIYLLRDHITLFIDLAKDWSSGPPTPYERFVPFHYKVHLRLQEHVLNLYLNEHNIIADPCNMAENTLMTLEGPNLDMEVVIPSDKYRPPSTDIPFEVKCPRARLSMQLPEWNTHNAFRTPRTKEFGTIETLTVSGSYFYYSTTDPQHVERLCIDIEADNVVYKMLGWTIRHFMILKDNYFGGFTAFSTVEEYRQRHEERLAGSSVERKSKSGKSDVFEVNLDVRLTGNWVILPQEVYDCKSALILEAPEISVSLRLHDFFMEMSLNIDPIRLTSVEDYADGLKQLRTVGFDTRKTLAIDGLEVVGDRIFGPQPKTSTYVCHWSFNIGAFVGNITPAFLLEAAAASRAVGVNYGDKDNSLPQEYVIGSDPDVTFLHLVQGPIDITVLNRESAINLRLDEGVRLDYNDMATPDYLRTLAIEVPTAAAKFLEPSKGSSGEEWVEVANLSSDISVNFYFTNSDWRTRAQAQFEHIVKQDVLTHRATDFYLPKDRQDRQRHGFPAQAGILQLHKVYLPGDGPLSGFSEEEDSIYTNSIASSSKSFRSAAGQSTSLFAQSDGSEAGNARKSDEGPCFGLRTFKRASPSQYGSFDGPTFSSTSDVPHQRQFKDIPSSRSQPSGRCWTPLNLHAFYRGGTTKYKDESQTICSLRSRRGVACLFTPFACGVLQDLLTQLDRLDEGLDKALDRLQSQFRDTRKPLPKYQFQTLFLDVSLPELRVRTIQDVNLLEPPVDRDKGHEGAGMSELELTVLGVDLNLAKTSSLVATDAEVGTETADLTLAFRFSQIEAIGFTGNAITRHLNWRKSAQLQQLRSDYVQHERHAPFLRVTVGATELTAGIKMRDAYAASLRLGAIDVCLYSDRFEALASTGVRLAGMGDEIGGAFEEFSRRRKRRLQLFVGEVVKFSDERVITTDPIFLTRAAFVAQAEQRNDPGWKIIARLRHVLRLMPSLNQRATKSIMNSKEVNPRRLFLNVVESLQKWRAWEIDADAVAHEPFIVELFDQGLTNGTSGNGLDRILGKDLSLNVSSGTVSVILEDDLSTPFMACGPLKLSVTASSRHRILSSEWDCGTFIHARTSLEQFSIQTTPQIFVTVERLLRAKRLYSTLGPTSDIDSSSKLRSSPHPEQASTQINEVLKKTGGLRVDFAGNLNDLNATFTADKLETRLILCQAFAYAPITLRSGEQAASLNALLLDAGATIGAKELKTVASEGTPRNSSSRTDPSVLAFFALEDATAHANVCEYSEPPPEVSHRTVRINVIMKAIETAVPRSFVRLHRFVDDWRTVNFPSIERLLKSLTEEAKRQTTPKARLEPSVRSTTRSSSEAWLVGARIDAQLLLQTISFRMRAMPTLWLHYNIVDATAFAHSNCLLSDDPNQAISIRCGVELAHQIFGFVPVQAAELYAKDTTPLKNGSIALPGLRATVTVPIGSSPKKGPARSTQAQVVVDMIKLTLTAKLIENVLALQSRFENDVDDLLDDIVQFKDSRARTESELSKPQPQPSKASKMSGRARAFSLSVALRGLKVAIEGPSSTQFIETALIDGLIRSGDKLPNKVSWRVSVCNLALSLAHKSRTSPVEQQLFDRSSRSAYTIIDCVVHNSRPELSNRSKVKVPEDIDHLHLRVNKVHAVLHATAISELGDLIDYWAEILVRKEERAEDYSVIRSKTRRVLESLERPTHEARSVATTEVASKSWLDDKVISVQINSLGIAIPLTLDEITAPDQSSSRPWRSAAVPAFLFSTSSITFATRHHEMGFADVQLTAFQFIPTFDQSRAEDFDGLQHDTRNRVLFPEMFLEVQSEKTGSTARRIVANSTVSGFELDVEASIVSYIFGLTDVYRKGKERLALLAELAEQPNLNISSSGPATPNVSDEQSSPSPKEQFRQALSLQAAFHFRSGALRFYPSEDTFTPPSSVPASPKQTRTAHRGGRKVRMAVEPDHFLLPELSAWAEYRDASSSPSSPTEKSINPTLLISAVIHSSNNILYPSLISFVRGVVRGVEERLQQPSTAPVSVPLTRPALVASLSTQEVEGGGMMGITPPAAIGRLQISFSLRIDQSKLELSCQPTSKVSARLFWESGGFIITVSPGLGAATFAANVGGISAGLKHAFSPEDCVLAELKNVTVAVSIDKITVDNKPSSVISASVDVPDLRGEVNFRHLQDWLVLKAVWIDRLPTFEAAQANQSAGANRPASVPSSGASSSGPSISHAVTLKIRQTVFAADLGPAIGRLSLDLKSIVFRTGYTPEKPRTGHVDIGNLLVTAQGRLAGEVMLEGTVFQTELRQHGRLSETLQTNLLSVKIRTGRLRAALEYEYRRFLMMEADPVKIEVEDDWRSGSGSHAQTQQVNLGFGVDLGTISVIAAIRTVPTLVALSHKISALIEEKQEAADDVTLIPVSFRKARTAKPSLDEVARKLQGDSATTTTTAAATAEPVTSVVPIGVVHRMHLKGERIRLALFPKYFSDSEMVKADTGLVTADLVSNAEQGSEKAAAAMSKSMGHAEQIHRDLKLHLGFFSLLRVSPKKVTPSEERALDLQQWFALFKASPRRSIFRAPTTDLSMESWQPRGGNKISHRFFMTFTGQVDIALNYALLKHLSDLATSYQEQMRQVDQPEPARTAFSPGQQPPSSASQEHRGSASPPRPASALSSDEQVEQEQVYGEGRVPSPPPRTKSPAIGEMDAHVVEAKDVYTSISAAPLSSLSGLSRRRSDSGEKVKRGPEVENEEGTKVRATTAGGREVLEFHAVEMVVHTPKLSFMGDATPPLEWVGVQRAKFPAWVHAGVVLTLEELIGTLGRVYRKQLKQLR